MHQNPISGKQLAANRANARPFFRPAHPGGQDRRRPKIPQTSTFAVARLLAVSKPVNSPGTLRRRCGSLSPSLESGFRTHPWKSPVLRNRAPLRPPSRSPNGFSPSVPCHRKKPFQNSQPHENKSSTAETNPFFLPTEQPIARVSAPILRPR